MASFGLESNSSSLLTSSVNYEILILMSWRHFRISCTKLRRWIANERKYFFCLISCIFRFFWVFDRDSM